MGESRPGCKHGNCGSCGLCLSDNLPACKHGIKGTCGFCIAAK